MNTLKSLYHDEHGGVFRNNLDVVCNYTGSLTR